MGEYNIYSSLELTVLVFLFCFMASSHLPLQQHGPSVDCFALFEVRVFCIVEYEVVV